MASSKLTPMATKKAKSKKAKVVEHNELLVASDPASLEAVLAELEAANSLSQVKAALVAIFTALLQER
ncbi:MAG: hypothetical protein K9K66_04485 [Desulfarculaceae bacterium]|nr:hypothetical protein [Desulfarculaceae bacterium]MCF8073301.1 hypothetical protein [Desulfarculaceae bacterium]MCF8100897.1 hypothetical protein [Desulfarculaceae bacterium]MCF8116647.1 hypothetical protein [Desulfarculaceae bacterium]